MHASRWPAPPFGALAAAITATQGERWRDAALLWRDLWQRNRPDPFAACCAAEGALRSSQLGFADHMLAQLPTLPPHLEELVDAHKRIRREQDAFCSEPEPIAAADARPAVEAFFRSHPLASLADPEVARLMANGFCSLPDGLETRRPETVFPQHAFIIPPHRRRIAHRDVARVRRHLSARVLGDAQLAQLIVELDRANVSDKDPLMQDACRRLAHLDAAGRCAPTVVAELYHQLGLATFAQALLRATLIHCADDDERRKVKRSLAKIAVDSDQLLNHTSVLKPGDFATAEAKLAHEVLRTRFTRLHPGVERVTAEPLVNAFDLLLAECFTKGEGYTPENRLLLVGSRLACGGTERLLAGTYRHFSKSDRFDAVDMALLNFKIGTPSAYFAKEAGLGKHDVVVLDPGAPAGLPFSLLPGDWKARSRKLFDHIVAMRPRVVHAWDEPTGILAAFAGLKAGCPKIVVHFHHCSLAALSRPRDSVASYPAVFRRLVEDPRFQFVFCSQAAARDYANWWNIPLPERFHTVYNGCDWIRSGLSKGEARRRIGIPADAAVVGTVIRFTPVKQPLLWAEAATRLAAKLPSVHFLMVGDGWLKEPVAEEFAAAGLRDRLHLPGQVSNVHDHLAAMDLFWLTSRTEGLSIVLVEAQYAGVPVLAFDCGGPRETFIDGETGILIRSGDTGKLADASYALLHDQEWLAEAGRRGHLNAARKFTAARFFEGLNAVYDR